MAGKLLQEEPVTLLVLVGTLQESLPWSIESVSNFVNKSVAKVKRVP